MPQLATHRTHHSGSFATSAFVSTPSKGTSLHHTAKASTKGVHRTSPYRLGRWSTTSGGGKKRKSGERKRRAMDDGESTDEILAAMDERLNRLEQSLQQRFASAGLSLFPSTATSSLTSNTDLPEAPSLDSVDHVEEGVRRLSVSPTLSFSPSSSSFSTTTATPASASSPVQRVFGALYIPDCDSALDSVSALYEHSTFFAPPNPSSSLDAPWTQMLLPPEEADGTDMRMAQILCGLRKRQAFASMSLFPELASPPPSSSYAASLYPPTTSPPSHSYPLTLAAASTPAHSTRPSSPTHSPYFSSTPASPAESDVDDSDWGSSAASTPPPVHEGGDEGDGEGACASCCKGGRRLSLPEPPHLSSLLARARSNTVTDSVPSPVTVQESSSRILSV